MISQKSIKTLQILYIGNRLSIHGYAPSANEILGPLLENYGYKLTYAGTRKNEFLRLIEMLSALIKHRKYSDVVLIDTYSKKAFYYAYVISIFCKLFKLQYICILHGGDLPYRLDRTPILSEQLFNGAFKLISVSKYLRNEFKKRGFFSEIIHNPINLDNYNFTPRVDVKANLIWVRSFHEIYNPFMAIDVVSNLLEKSHNVKLCMVGPEKDGSMKKCKSTVFQRGLSNHITFTGFLSREEWAKLAGDYDIFINTTNYDNFPFSVVEAMALGLPVVSTDAGGIPDIIEHTKNGLLGKTRDTNQMVQNIELLIKDSKLSKNISFSSRAFTEQLSSVKIIAKWVKVLARVPARKFN